MATPGLRASHTAGKTPTRTRTPGRLRATPGKFGGSMTDVEGDTKSLGQLKVPRLKLGRLTASDADSPPGASNAAGATQVAPGRVQHSRAPSEGSATIVSKPTPQSQARAGLRIARVPSEAQSDVETTLACQTAIVKRRQAHIHAIQLDSFGSQCFVDQAGLVRDCCISRCSATPHICPGGGQVQAAVHAGALWRLLLRCPLHTLPSLSLSTGCEPSPSFKLGASSPAS